MNKGLSEKCLRMKIIGIRITGRQEIRLGANWTNEWGKNASKVLKLRGHVQSAGSKMSVQLLSTAHGSVEK